MQAADHHGLLLKLRYETTICTVCIMLLLITQAFIITQVALQDKACVVACPAFVWGGSGVWHGHYKQSKVITCAFGLGPVLGHSADRASHCPGVNWSPHLVTCFVVLLFHALLLCVHADLYVCLGLLAERNSTTHPTSLDDAANQA